MPLIPGFDDAELSQRRVCRSCEAIFTIAEGWASNAVLFDKPHDYRSGCREYCLSCWLGVGPLDDENLEKVEDWLAGLEGNEDVDADDRLAASVSVVLDGAAAETPDEDDLLGRFQSFLADGCLIAVMPISRIHVESPMIYRDCFVFFPPGTANLYVLKIVPNRELCGSLAEVTSAGSGIDERLLNELPLVAFPCRGDWEAFRRSGHRGHLDLIRQLSEAVDNACLNFIRYKLCNFDPVDTLPGRAGQVDTDPMMAGLCLYNHTIKESRIVGGAAFTHMITRGLGLALESIENNEFPRDGEVGHIVEHGLELYANAIEAITDTSRFVQSLSLLEFLAAPESFLSFTDVSKVVAKYVARDQKHYAALLERFKQLTGKFDKVRKIETGYRTRIVHIGERLEKIIPQHDQRRDLFRELNLYIRQILEHMIAHSDLTWDEYLTNRNTLRPFET